MRNVSLDSRKYENRAQKHGRPHGIHARTSTMSRAWTRFGEKGKKVAKKKWARAVIPLRKSDNAKLWELLDFSALRRSPAV